MDNIIKKSENINLSGDDIYNIVDGQIKILSYDDLHNIYNIENLLSPYNSVAILYTTTKNLNHWIGLFKVNDNTLEFFDPYGLNIDEELNLEKKLYLRPTDNDNVPHLTDLINNSNYKVIYNNVKLQKFLEHTNTCGRHVGVRLRFKNLPLQQYLKLFKNNKFDPDYIVSSLTLLFSDVIL
jgi:hypothetical protein